MEIGIEILGLFNDISGFAHTGRNLALAAYDLGIPTRIIQLQHNGVIPADLDLITKKKLALMHSAPLGKHVFMHHMPPTWITGKKDGVPNIVYSVFETDRIPFVWSQIVDQTKELKEVWVPTEFNRTTFEAGGIPAEQLFILPHGVDEIKYSPDIQPLNIRDRAGFNFLSIMDLKECKGYDILLDAYFSEFSDKDDVCLILKAYATGVDEQSKQKLKVLITSYREKHKSTAKLLFIGDKLEESEIAALQRAADCFVLPTRGEGWAHNLCQSLACGVPVIATDATGHRTYLNETNSLLIKCEKQLITNIKWLIREPWQGGHSWWEPSLEDTKAKMRWAYSHPQEMKALGVKARQDILQFTWKKAAIKLANNLIRIGNNQ